MSKANAFMLLTSVFVFLIGMVGLNFYNESKTESRVSRLNYTAFIGYVLGLGTILFFVGTKQPNGMSGQFATGFLSVVTLLVWTMCAMMISDMKKENKDKGIAYTFTAWMLGIMLILWLVFMALTFTPMGRAIMGGQLPTKIPSVRYGGYGGDLNSPLYGFGRNRY